MNVDGKTRYCVACEKQARPSPDLQRMVVAVSACSTSAVAIHVSPGIEDDFREGCLDAADVLDLRDVEPGLRVWEGKIINRGYPFTREWNVDYQGDFRPLTDEEWTALREGRLLWPEYLTQDVGPHTCGMVLPSGSGG